MSQTFTSIFFFQNGVIRGLLLAFRFMGKDRGGPGGIVVNAGSSCCRNPLVSLPVSVFVEETRILFSNRPSYSSEASQEQTGFHDNCNSALIQHHRLVQRKFASVATRGVPFFATIAMQFFKKRCQPRWTFNWFIFLLKGLHINQACRGRSNTVLWRLISREFDGD